MRSGYDVAIVARNAEKLQKTQDQYAAQGKKVIGFPFDLSDSAAIPGLINKVWETMGGIDACLYNSSRSAPYTATTEEFVATVNLNITSLHIAFGALLPLWRLRGTGGSFMMSGGGFAENGAYSVPYGMQLGAATKSYMKNFAQVSIFLKSIYILQLTFT